MQTFTASSAVVSVSELPPMARFSLRLRDPKTAPFDIPWHIGTCTRDGAREVLCLGPDEWLILVPEAAARDIQSQYANLEVSHALTDISHRERSFLIEGPKAADLITLGCPRDPDSLKDGEARRTVFDGASVILWRDSSTRFRMDIWRSFAPHACHLMEIGVRELALD